MSSPVVIFTLANDLHALAIWRLLVSRGIVCHVVETSNMIARGGIKWSSDPDGPGSLLQSREGDWFDLSDAGVLWWRRVNSPQIIPPGIEDPAAVDLINSDWKAALFGSAITSFHGTWINLPESTRRAENKMVQLKAAASVGLRIPRTLVTQDPATVREFWDASGGQVVTKALRGTNLAQLAAINLTDPSEIHEDAFTLSPAIYQELIPGTEHLRINCFGERVLAVHIQSGTMDWRRNLDVKFEQLELTPKLESQVLTVLDDLGLAMGVVDMKITPEGEPVWLEVNPQGQFLFLEPLAGIDLTNPFADFLADALKTHHELNPRASTLTD